MLLLMAALTTAACDSSKGAAPEANSATPDKTLEAGDAAPDVELTLHTGDKVKLSSLRGSKVFLWFYPKDDTPG